MRHFTNVHDIGDLKTAVREALEVKANRFAYKHLGQDKALMMIFFNSSLRTRLSTQKAAMNLGMNVMVLDVNQGAWKLDDRTRRGDGRRQTRASARGYPRDGLLLRRHRGTLLCPLRKQARRLRREDLNQFIQYSGRPVFSMEAATRHPLQSFADLITIEEHKQTERPKVVLTGRLTPRRYRKQYTLR